MRLVGGSDLLRDGFNIGRWIPALAVDFDIDFDGSTGFILRGLADDPFEIAVHAPAVVAATYAVDPTPLLTGPILLSPPRATGTPTPGQTLSAESGLLLRDPVFGKPATVFSWFRGGVFVQEGPSYQVQAADTQFGVTLHQSVITAAGQIQASATVIDSPSYAEQGVAFDGGDILTSPDDVAMTTPEARSIVVFASFETDATATGVERIVDIGGLRLQRTAAGALSLRAEDDTGGTATASTSVGLSRYHVLARVTWSSSYGIDITLAVAEAGGSWTTLSAGTAPGTASQLAIDDVMAIGGRNTQQTSQAFRGTVYRAAAWANAANIDVADAEVQTFFVAGDGSLRQPDLAETLLGQAEVDWHGAKPDAIAGAHDGLQGHLAVIGTPTLVGDVPDLPEGYAFTVDPNGAFLVDGSGNFLIVEAA